MATVFTLHVGFSDASGDASNTSINRGFLFGVLARTGFAGYTVLDGIGCYQGKQEPGATVIFIAQTPNEATELGSLVKKAAIEYKNLANQEEVWLTVREETLEII